MGASLVSKFFDSHVHMFGEQDAVSVLNFINKNSLPKSHELVPLTNLAT